MGLLVVVVTVFVLFVIVHVTWRSGQSLVGLLRFSCDQTKGNFLWKLETEVLPPPRSSMSSCVSPDNFTQTANHPLNVLVLDEQRAWNRMMKCSSWHGSVSSVDNIIATLTPDHLLMDTSPNTGLLISRWELDQFKNCWNKSFKASKILTLLYRQFSDLLISQRDVSGPRLGALSNSRWSGSIFSSLFVQTWLLDNCSSTHREGHLSVVRVFC